VATRTPGCAFDHPHRHAEGYRRLLVLLADAGDTAQDPIPVAVETARGLLISCLRTTGRAVYSINPMAVARYRERHRVTRAKSDHADAMALANILRTDADMPSSSASPEPRWAVLKSWDALPRRWELGPAQGARMPRRDHGLQPGCCRPWEPT
jgi:hypothetical protein